MFALVVRRCCWRRRRTTARLSRSSSGRPSALRETDCRTRHAAFVRHLAEDTIFLGRRAQRGKAEVAAAWKGFFEGPKAPFSWEPERVEVNDAGTLGISTGPVRDENGKQTGTYSSIWRREKDGRWRIIFDNGCTRAPAAVRAFSVTGAVATPHRRG